MSYSPLFNGAPTPFSFKGGAAKLAFPTRSSSRGLEPMSDKSKSKLAEESVKLALGFLRARHPLKTAENVAVETGISKHAVNHWLQGNSRPSWWHTLALIGTYGPDFLAAVSPRSRVWIEPAQKLEELRQLECKRVQINQRIKELGGSQNNENLGMGQGNSNKNITVDQGDSATSSIAVSFGGDPARPVRDLAGDGGLDDETGEPGR